MLAEVNELSPSFEHVPILLVCGITVLMLPAIQADPCALVHVHNIESWKGLGWKGP